MAWNNLHRLPLMVRFKENPDGVRIASSEEIVFKDKDGNEAEGRFWVTHFAKGRSVLSRSFNPAIAWRHFIPGEPRGIK